MPACPGTQSPPNSSRAASFPENLQEKFKKMHIITAATFRHSALAPEPVEAKSVFYRGTASGDKMQASIRFFSASFRRPYQ
jgi:hypothetical protein